MEFDNENSRCVSAGPEPDAMWANLDDWEPVPTPETPEVHP